MKGKNGEHPFGDFGQLILFLCFMLVWIGDSFFLRGSAFLSTYIPVYARLLIMIFALGFAVWLAKSGHVVVSHKHHPAGIASSGAFRYVRHPLYLASLLFYFGLAVSTACLLSFGLLLVIFFFYDFIARYEEKLLEGKYGEDYLHYKKITGKWLPKFRSTRTKA
jgi:protein-S-isoprenylcysteine O-methyltransferase Ste14